MSQQHSPDLQILFLYKAGNNNNIRLMTIKPGRAPKALLMERTDIAFTSFDSEYNSSISQR